MTAPVPTPVPVPVPAPVPNAQPLTTSRGRVGSRYYAMTPDTMVENSLPMLPPSSVVVLAAPQGTPARFGQYLVTLAAGSGTTGEIGVGYENFLFVRSGSLRVRSDGDTWTLGAETYLFLPSGRTFEMHANAATTLIWVKKAYTPAVGIAPPEVVHGRLADVEDTADDWIDGTYGQLLPDDVRYDMAMNIMRFESGARFRMIEIHHQEHGLYMLDGGGVYHLDGDHVEVRADDFIYMAPYCTQAFTVAGAGPTAYLLYKDVNRDGF